MAHAVNPSEKQEQDQHDNEGGRFEKRDAEQALIFQHVAPPPGRSCHHRRPFFLRDTPYGRREFSSGSSSPTLTRYFLSGQGYPHSCVPSHIMPMGSQPTWRSKTYWSWMTRKRFEKSSRRCLSPRGIAAPPCRTAAWLKSRSRSRPLTSF